MWRDTSDNMSITVQNNLDGSVRQRALADDSVLSKRGNVNTSTSTNTNLNVSKSTNTNVNTNNTTSNNTNNNYSESISITNNTNINDTIISATNINKNQSESVSTNENTNINLSTVDSNSTSVNTNNNTNVNETTSDNTNTNISTSESVSTSNNTNNNNNVNENRNVSESNQNQNINQKIESPPPSAIAPSIGASFSQDLCTTGVSGAVQTQIFGISGGKSITDTNCERIKLAKTIYDMGMRVAAVSLMCQDERVWTAMKMAGTPCPIQGMIGDEAGAAWEENLADIPGVSDRDIKKNKVTTSPNMPN